MRRMRLPVVGSGETSAGAPPPGTPGGEGVPVDPERIADGWEPRFTAQGARAEEMAALYRELGFEVVADPVPREGLDPGCEGCFSGTLEYRLIYTRRRKAPGDSPAEEGD